MKEYVHVDDTIRQTVEMYPILQHLQVFNDILELGDGLTVEDFKYMLGLENSITSISPLNSETCNIMLNELAKRGYDIQKKDGGVANKISLKDYLSNNQRFERDLAILTNNVREYVLQKGQRVSKVEHYTPMRETKGNAYLL